MKRKAPKNGWVQGFYIIAILYGGSCLGTSLLIALAK